MRISHFYLMLLFAFITALSACELTDDATGATMPPGGTMEPVDSSIFYRGADLSYVNEMLDCGAVYLNEDGTAEDPYTIFSLAGTDLVRVRLWHNPDWTAYSNFEDVKKTIARAKANQMSVLLDFHYSDDWADPNSQKVPAAWLPVVNDSQILGDSLYNYTYSVLEKLQASDLMPEFVQVGNEINIEILQDPDVTYDEINWVRNAALINRGIKAVRAIAAKFNKDIEIMLHLAQPENGLWWFKAAKQYGVTDFDWIALSYYPKWSSYPLDDLPTAIQTLIRTFDKRLMIVETAYPFTLNNNDSANNILGDDALIAGYPATEQGQYDYLKALEEKINTGGGEGLIYWEPAWVSTACSTRWGQGSHWDNATLFKNNNQVNLGMKYYSGD